MGDNENINKKDLDCKGKSGYKVQNEDELTKVEQLCLDTMDDNPTAKNLCTLNLATIFKGPKNQFET